MLDELIHAAAAKAAASQEAWTKKHFPVKIGEEVVWLSTEMPAEIRQVLDVLPEEPEKHNAKRPHQIKTRLSDEELESFEILVQVSGLSQAEYIRGMVLNGSVSVTQTSLADAQMLDTLTEISGTLGKLSGMIRMTVIANKEFKVLTYEEKDHLECQLRSLRQLQSYIQALAETIYGNL